MKILTLALIAFFLTACNAQTEKKENLTEESADSLKVSDQKGENEHNIKIKAVSVSSKDSINAVNNFKILIEKWKKDSLEKDAIWISRNRKIDQLTEKERMEKWCYFEPDNFFLGDINGDGIIDGFCKIDNGQCGGGSMFMYSFENLFFVSNEDKSYKIISFEGIEGNAFPSGIKNNCKLLWEPISITNEGKLLVKFFEHHYEGQYSLERLFEFKNDKFVPTDYYRCQECKSVFDYKTNVSHEISNALYCEKDTKYTYCKKCMKK